MRCRIIPTFDALVSCYTSKILICAAKTFFTFIMYSRYCSHLQFISQYSIFYVYLIDGAAITLVASSL